MLSAMFSFDAIWDIAVWKMWLNSSSVFSDEIKFKDEKNP